jgi:hypothetical protein
VNSRHVLFVSAGNERQQGRTGNILPVCAALSAAVTAAVTGVQGQCSNAHKVTVLLNHVRPFSTI